MNHEKVFKLARLDTEFQEALELSNQKIPQGNTWLIDTMDRGVWAAGYAGWVLGRFGYTEYNRRVIEWRKL